MLVTLKLLRNATTLQQVRKAHSIAYIGNPVLRATAKPLAKSEITDSSTRKLISGMKHALREEAGIGLAAPQVSALKQLIILEIPVSPLLPNVQHVPFTVLINPQVEVVDNAYISVWESCLSVPGYWGAVNRHKVVRVQFLDTNGAERTMEASGLIAAVVQHETDHLHGKIFLDRLSGLSSLVFEEVFQNTYMEESCKMAGGFRYL